MTAARPGPTLAVDPGTARIGLALSDGLGLAIRPLEPLRSAGRRRDLEALARLAREACVVRVVVGLPRSLTGSEGRAAAAARRFAAGLRGRLPDVVVELWDEALTTVESERLLASAGLGRAERRRRVDGLSATLLLQDWLAAREGGREPAE